MVIVGVTAWFIFYCLGEYLSKQYSLAPSVSLIFMTVAAYSMAVLAWLPALRGHGSLTILGTITSVLSAVAAIGIGILIFKEPVTARQCVGMGLALLALILLY